MKLCDIGMIADSPLKDIGVALRQMINLCLGMNPGMSFASQYNGNACHVADHGELHFYHQLANGI